MIIKFSNFTLDIDIERTRAFYERSDVPTMSEQCDCINCRNFDKAILKASDPVLSFLSSLGIDPRKPTETFNVTGTIEKEGTIWYNGWYHICGRMVESSETVNTNIHNDSSNTENCTHRQCFFPDPCFDFSVHPVEKNALLHKEFPLPVIQLEIETHLPYILTVPFER